MCEKTLHAHPEGVTGLSIHPSGKMALSVGKDRSLKTWNLIKGRSGYTTNLKLVGEYIQWSTEGNYYAVSLADRVDVYSVHSAKIVYTIPFGKRVSHITFINVSSMFIVYSV
jgi:protein MAK11